MLAWEKRKYGIEEENREKEEKEKIEEKEEKSKFVNL